MANIVTLNPSFGAVSSVFAGRQIENAAAAGIQGSYAHIGYKGKNWSIRYQGNESVVLREDGSPQWSLELIVVRAAVPISKIYYTGWVDGTHDAPDCFSTNGLLPDPGAMKKQAPACKGCPMNVWGSRITEDGKPAKACRDSRRIAVVPGNNIKNEALGGPMLLRVPAASLSDYAEFTKQMERQGYPYNSFVTRFAFDPTKSFPKFVVTAVRPLNDQEGAMVMEWFDSPEVERILSEAIPEVTPQVTPASPFEQPGAGIGQGAPQQHSAPAPAPAPAQAAAAAPARATPSQAQPAQTMPNPAAMGFGGPAAQVQQPVQQPAQQDNTPPATTPPPAVVSAEAAPTEAAPSGAVDFDKQLDALLGAAA